MVFDIKEGDQFRVGKLSIKDAKPADEKKWLALLGVKKGDIFSRTAMTTGMQKLQDATKAADITPMTKVDAAKKTIDVEFDSRDSEVGQPELEVDLGRVAFDAVAEVDAEQRQHDRLDVGAHADADVVADTTCGRAGRAGRCGRRRGSSNAVIAGVVEARARGT